MPAVRKVHAASVQGRTQRAQVMVVVDALDAQRLAIDDQALRRIRRNKKASD